MGNITNNGTVDFNQGKAGTYAGSMSGNGTLVMSGIGSLTLSGLNSYTGGTLVTAGTLIGSTTSILGNVSLTNSATVAFNQAKGAIFTNTISGTGNLTKLGVGSLTLGGVSDYSGFTTVSAGTLVFTNGSAITALRSTLINNATTLLSTPFASPGTFSGDLQGSSKGVLSKIGNGTVTLAGANSSYLGTISISAGGIAANNLGTGALKLTGATSGASAGTPVFTSTKASGLTLNSGPITLGGNAVIAFQNPGTNSVASMTSSSTVTVNGVNNTLQITMSDWAVGNYTLLLATKISGSGLKSLVLGDSASSVKITLGSTTNIGGEYYTFNINKASKNLYLNVSTNATPPPQPVVALRSGSVARTPVSGIATNLTAPLAGTGRSVATTPATNTLALATNSTTNALASNGTSTNIANYRVTPAIAVAATPTPTPVPQVNYAAYAQNQNQTNVARALNTFQGGAPGSDQQSVVSALNKLSPSQLPAAFNAVSSLFYQSLSTIAFNLANAQNSELLQRLWGVRVAGTGFSMNGFADNTPILEGQGDGKGYKDPSKDILRPGADTHWGMFVDGNGVFAQANSGNMLPTYNAQSGGVTTGLTYKWNDTFGTGLYAGYEGTYAKYNGGSTLIDNSVRFGGFATYGQKDGKGFYADALAGGGYNNYAVHRNISFGSINRSATSSPGAAELDTMLAGGYDLKKGNWTYGPTASLQYTTFGISSFSETGAQSLNLGNAGWNTASMIGSLGAHGAYTWQAGRNIVVVPQINLNWQHEFMQNAYGINSTMGGGNFSNSSSAPLRNSLYTGVGVTVEFNKKWNTSFFYNAAAGNNNLTSQNIFWSLGLKF